MNDEDRSQIDAEAEEDALWESAFRRAFSDEGATGTESVLAVLARGGAATEHVHLADDRGEDPPLVRAGGDADVPGGRHGRYQVLGEIARGGLGVVLQARDTDLGRDVAMKVLREDHGTDGGQIPRFVEEAQVGGQLQHPGIVPVYEMGLLEGRRPFFTMKLVKGRTLLAQLLDRKDPAEDRRRFLRIFEQVCQTIAYTHSRGVVHRDLKPANVMVGTFGEVQVIDWGCAKVLARGGLADEVRAQAFELEEEITTVRSGPGTETVAGSAIGTPAYMAPEQACGDQEAIDERTDVFCLGGILCEILTGRPPYVNESAGQVLSAASRGDLTDTWRRLESSDADPELVDLARGCLESYRQKRPADAGEVAARISAYLSGLETRARNAEMSAAEERAKASAERRAKRLAIGLGVAVVCVLLSVAGIFVHRGVRASETTRDVTAILASASDYAVRGDWENAAGEALRAKTRLGDPRRDDELAALIVGRLEEYRNRVREAQLLRAIEAVRYSEAVNLRHADERYAAAFREFGIDVDALSPEEIAAKIAASGEAASEAIVRSLDDWISRRDTSRERARKLIQAANLVDRDVWREKLRLAILTNDRELLRSRAASLEQTPQAPESFVLLSHAFMGPRGEEEVEAARAVLRVGYRMYPGDFWINFRLAMKSLMHDGGEFDEAVTHARIARSLRPRSPVVSGSLGLILLARRVAGEGRPGDLDEARKLLAFARREIPDDPMSKLAGAALLAAEGKRREAWRQAERVLEEHPNPEHARQVVTRLLGKHPK